MEANALFVDIAEGFTITTYFEKEKTRGVQVRPSLPWNIRMLTRVCPIQVVNEGSARLNKTKEYVIGLDGNHQDMCKFPTTDDPMYRNILRRLKAEVSQIQLEEAEKEHEQRVQQILESVPPVVTEQYL